VWNGSRTKHVMAQHTRGKRSHAFPLQIRVHELPIARQRPAVNVQNEHLLPQLVPELGLLAQVVYVAVLVGEVRRIDRVQYGAVERFNYGGHRNVVGVECNILCMRISVVC
jgi:hypothetical protein